MARAAAEATLVPDEVLRDHLLGRVHRVAATGATVAVVSLCAELGLRVHAGEEEEIFVNTFRAVELPFEEGPSKGTIRGRISGPV